MKKTLLAGFAMGLLMVGMAGLAGATPVAINDWTGSRTIDVDDTAADTLVGNGNWTHGFTLGWSIMQVGMNYQYTYTYSLGSYLIWVPQRGQTPGHYEEKSVQGNVSHYIFEVSTNLTTQDIWNIIFEGPKTYTPNDSNSNPGMPANIWGIKINDPASSITFMSSRAPMWGDFYSKDGNAGGQGDNYVYNLGFGTDPGANTQDFTNWVAVPDTHENPVPEPATMLLMGTGLAGLAAARRRRAAKK